jgi:hypothetical protein
MFKATLLEIRKEREGREGERRGMEKREGREGGGRKEGRKEGRKYLKM